jgi:peptidase S46-like protein
MKKWVAISLLSLCSLGGLAEEGFWLPALLGDQVYAEMVKKGLKLSREQLYSINKNSLKDGILHFNDESSGTVIGTDGLFLTNYRQAFKALSFSDDQPRITNGFFAGKRADEIPVKNFFVDFLVKVDDVTAEMEDAAKGATGLDLAARLNLAKQGIELRFSNETNSQIARVQAVLKGNQWLVFVYQRFRDIRLVVSPPRSMAEFGSSGGYWDWPAFKDDFALFRIYTAADGRPAGFNAANIPFKPKYVFPISTKGIRENDFSLVAGYPGSTSRYETSMGIKLQTDIVDPALIKLLTIQRDYVREEMKKDPSVNIQLGPKEQELSISTAFYEGELDRLTKSPIYTTHKNMEEAFRQWAGGKTDYETIFKDWPRLFGVWSPYAKHRVYLNVGILGSSLMGFAAAMQRLDNALVKVNAGDPRKILAELNNSRQQFLALENKSVDKKILASMLKFFYADIDKNQHPIGFFESMKGSFGDLKDEGSYAKYVNAVFSSTMIFDDAKWNAFNSNPDASVLQDDPAYKLVNSFLMNWQGKYAVYYRQYLAGDMELGKTYLKGIQLMDPKISRYSDADSTMRFSLGNIKSYSPGASIHYDANTYMSGMLEKQANTVLPGTFLEKAKKKDFGPWVDKSKNDLAVAFISTNDITRGSQGSAVLNANGELVGLMISGNKENLASYYLYNIAESRAICLDVRMIMWTIETGGAGNFGNEIRLAK